MWRTNLKVIALGAVVIGFYTLIANIIPQVQSEVPEVLDLRGLTPFTDFSFIVSAPSHRQVQAISDAVER